ncbi:MULTISPECIES: helix-turn-helix domain-containing protein [Acinetobacter calcoaceticus/baumannii complex]|nr:helix-turn-helix transcriptional regulator [Acinetobacter baumannii]MDC5505998.1 helix-turn-helix domain-containing protein [Acinetobacter baumannii]TPS34650.1 helix-turn-helix transcriptional regulator [Acinetobacter baumannii]UAA84175.1 helix-turn-helix transcriptional regulator [Acinetobacter baumannii]CAA0222821.1 Helix-turn-helix family protein [Acinetobacter baumannii]HEN9571383.1 helix-turn-helix transcriptional regulator [Acinetobacter baumannii]
MKNSIYTNEMNVLCQWLKSQRKAQKLTMRSLSERMDRPHSFIQKVEQGERRLDVVEYVWYCEKLNIDPIVGIKLVIKQHKDD